MLDLAGSYHEVLKLFVMEKSESPKARKQDADICLLFGSFVEIVCLLLVWLQLGKLRFKVGELVAKVAE